MLNAKLNCLPLIYGHNLDSKHDNDYDNILRDIPYMDAIGIM